MLCRDSYPGSLTTNGGTYSSISYNVLVPIVFSKIFGAFMSDLIHLELKSTKCGIDFEDKKARN